MAVSAKKEKVKVVLKFRQGSQTLTRCNHSASDEALHQFGEAIASLNVEPVKSITKVTEEQLIKSV